MANINEHFQGATIVIDVMPDSGVALTDPQMLVYRDNLDLTDPASSGKIKTSDGDNPDITRESISGGFKFSIPANVTKGMEPGDYTIEIYYGNREIVRSNRAFTLVSSGVAIMD